MNITYKVFTCAQLPPPNLCLGGPPIYCTDCLTPNGTGGYVQSDGATWRLFNGLEATTDALTYFRSYNLTQGACYAEFPTDLVYIGSITVPTLTRGGVIVNGTGASSGIGHSTVSKYATSVRITAGTTATGQGGQYTWQSGGWGIQTVVQHFYTCADINVSALSAAADEYRIELGNVGDTSTPNARTACIVYDRVNTYGHNAANTATWWKLYRTGSSNVNAVDSGVTVSTTAATPDRLEILQTGTSFRAFVNGVELGSSESTPGGLFYAKVVMINTAYTSTQKYMWINRFVHVARRSTPYS